MPESAPFRRIVRVDAIPQDGQTLTIEASPSEREALASLYQIPAIAALTATLRLERAGQGGARVVGRGPCRFHPNLRRFARTVRRDR